MVCCGICGLWYPYVGRDRLDIRLEGPTAREALEAYVDSSTQQMTPRQGEAMRRIIARGED